jgi:hypothetical protein
MLAFLHLLALGFCVLPRDRRVRRPRARSDCQPHQLARAGLEGLSTLRLLLLLLRPQPQPQHGAIRRRQLHQLRGARGPLHTQPLLLPSPLLLLLRPSTAIATARCHPSASATPAACYRASSHSGPAAAAAARGRAAAPSTARRQHQQHGSGVFGGHATTHG